MRFLYTVILFLLLPLILLRLYILGIKKPAYRLRWQERLGIFPAGAIKPPLIWLHAVSVGEVNAATPLINQLRAAYQTHTILVTTVTPTGAATIKQNFGDSILHHYLPYDLPFAVYKFLTQFQPLVFIAIETEIWPNLYRACYALNIPILMVNARLSEKSLKGYQLCAGLMQKTLATVAVIAAQTEQDASRFMALGVHEKKLVVTGNLKFDRAGATAALAPTTALRQYFRTHRPIWIAASTRAGEEKIILAAHQQVLKQYPKAILILAPRHPERITALVAYCQQFGFSYEQKTTRSALFPKHCAVYLLDTLGALQQHYAVAQLAFVGGSLVNTGGQNMIEPASLGLPVLTGPYTYNFIEITRLLSEQQALIVVTNAAELTQAVCQLFANPDHQQQLGARGRAVVAANQGSTDRLMQLIQPYLLC